MAKNLNLNDLENVAGGQGENLDYCVTILPYANTVAGKVTIVGYYADQASAKTNAIAAANQKLAENPQYTSVNYTISKKENLRSVVVDSDTISR